LPKGAGDDGDYTAEQINEATPAEAMKMRAINSLNNIIRNPQLLKYFSSAEDAERWVDGMATRAGWKQYAYKAYPQGPPGGATKWGNGKGKLIFLERAGLGGKELVDGTKIAPGQYYFRTSNPSARPGQTKEWVPVKGKALPYDIRHPPRQLTR
jgi:hypothetical protein